jgi:hypothetical protein
MFGLNKKPKLCRDCKHFNTSFEMYNHTRGTCKEATVTSAPFTADFISSDWPIKVWWNFGCIRFKKK